MKYICRTGTPERGASAFESMSEASESVTPYQQKSMEDCDDYEPSGNFTNDRRDHTKAYRVSSIPRSTHI